MNEKQREYIQIGNQLLALAKNGQLGYTEGEIRQLQGGFTAHIQTNGKSHFLKWPFLMMLIGSFAGGIIAGDLLYFAVFVGLVVAFFVVKNIQSQYLKYHDDYIKFCDNNLGVIQNKGVG